MADRRCRLEHWGKEQDMTRHRFSVTAAALMGAITFSAALAAENPSPSWDGLIAVKSKRLEAVYLMPGADFRTYTKVMFDPVEVALKKDWLRDYNRTTDLSGKISNADVQKAFETIRTKFTDIFAKAYSDAGYQVVTMPGPDVLRVRTGVMNLSVTAPDTRPAGSSRTYSREAGEATLILEARDSESGAVMGRAVDRELAGDTSRLMRNSVTNQSDFSRLFADWAKESVAGLAELKALSPVNIGALPLK